ncbi:uncharacterized protein LOC114304715 [Camellia sinensis]|uniref:uncharacterized protein LOC114304715 n=1 Tax=Camellia sinensis TaxID=4442 RepID=UPI001035F92A|nr:uncharacterized protein LOC114304715 [Camellia sinensis]
MLLTTPALRKNMRDILRWMADTSGSFSITSAYRWSQLGHGANSKIIEFIWKNVSPPKVQFFGWLAWKERVKSSSYLQKIGVLNAGSTVNCIFCNGDVESVYSIGGLVWKLSKQLKLILNVIPLVVLWSIWKQRNDYLFNSAQVNIEGLCDSIKVRIALWIKSSCPVVLYSVNDIAHHLQQVIVYLG